MSVVVASHPALPRWAAAGRNLAAPWALAFAATVFLVAISLAGAGPPLTDWLGDTDDAVRLLSVRDLLAGGSWFDTTLARIGAPAPLVSHWSRLVDLPLAAIMAALTPPLGAERAELATRLLWPALTFFTLALIVAREAQRRGGILAAAFVLVLLATSPMALAQFRPGRVDHHNVQILCAVAGLLFLVRSVREPRMGWVAGALLGLGLAVGYEAIALVVPALGIAALVALLQQPRRSPLGSGALPAAIAATAVLFAAFIATVPPARWLAVHCDALSLNLLALAACGTAGLAAALSLGRSLWVRGGLVVASFAVGAFIYVRLEPACLAGPFGQVGPQLASIWLDQVSETKSLAWLASRHPATGFGLAAFLIAGAAAQLHLWRRNLDAASGLMTAFVLLAVAFGCWQIKLLPYACWLAALPLGLWAAGLAGTRSLSAPVVRVAAVLLLGQTTLDTAFAALLSPFQQRPTGAAMAVASDVDAADPHRPCFLSHNVRALAALPPGLIVADVDLGPYLVALTPHRVVAAPYHRLETGILAGHAILSGPPTEAGKRMAVLGVAYVALCADRWPRRARAPATDAPLRTQLLDGTPVAFLEEVPLPATSAIKVWRVRAPR